MEHEQRLIDENPEVDDSMNSGLTGDIADKVGSIVDRPNLGFPSEDHQRDWENHTRRQTTMGD